MKRPWLLGAGVALLTIVIGVAIVLLATSGDGGSSGAAQSGGDVKTSNKKSGASSTTTSSTTTTTSPSPATAPPNADPTVPTTTAAPIDNTPDPPDPADRYQPVAMPAGVSANITSCSWSPASGGVLEATGTVTNTAGDDDTWLVTAVWLTHNVNQDEELDEDTDLLDIAVGQTITWHLTTAATQAPPNLSCALEVE